MRDDPELGALEREWRARLQLEHLRALRLGAVRRVALASIPVWLEVHLHFLPGLLAWLAFLVQGAFVAIAVCYVALECRWARRAAQVDPGPSAAVIHARWTDWDEVRSALWHGVGLLSLVPWLYVGWGRPMPAPLLYPLTATLWTVLLLLGAAESIASLRPRAGPLSRRRRAAETRSPSVGQGGPAG